MPEARKAFGGLLPAGEGRWSFSCDQLWWSFECCTEFWAPPYKTCMACLGILEKVQQRATKMSTWLKHLFYGRKAGRTGTVQPGKRRLKGLLSTCINMWREGAKRMRPGSCQWCPVTGQEATGTNKSTKGVICTSGSTFVFCIVRRIEQGNQRHFEVCLLRGICSLTGHSSEHPSLCAPGRGGVEADGLGSPCQPQPFCDSGVMDNCF